MPLQFWKMKFLGEWLMQSFQCWFFVCGLFFSCADSLETMSVRDSQAGVKNVKQIIRKITDLALSQVIFFSVTSLEIWLVSHYWMRKKSFES